MGFLWDLVQQSQISTAQQQNASLADRVASLESELRQTRECCTRSSRDSNRTCGRMNATDE